MIKLRRSSVVLVTTSLVITGLGMSAATARPGQAKHGGYVDDVHVPGGYVRSLAAAKDGTRHWAAGGRRYYSLSTGGKFRRTGLRWSSSFPPSDPPELLSVVPSVNGRQIIAVTAGCGSMQVNAVPQDARRLPKISPRQNVLTADCDTDNLRTINSVVALAHHRVAVVFSLDPHGADNAVAYVGKPGHQFHRHILPLSGTLGTQNLYHVARDPRNGALYVATIDDARELRVWFARTSHVPFRLLPVVSLRRNPGAVTAIAASHKQVWIAIQGGPGGHGSFLVHRKAGGAWRAERRVPGTHPDEDDVLVAADPRASRTRFWAAYTAKSEQPGYAQADGVVSLRVGGGKAHRRTLKIGTYDSLDALTVTWHGKPSIGHEVR
jgi:hypothetical protein